MGIICSFGLQKGGVGKTSSTGITGYLLAEQGQRVLLVDYDSQGNLTQLVSGNSPYAYVHKTIFEAVKERDPRPYIVHLHDNLDLIPAEDFLSSLGRWMYQEYREPRDPMLLLKDTLDKVKDEYDWILIDLPPNLGEQTITGIGASDYCVVVSMCEPFSYDAIERYLEMLQAAQERIRPDIKLAGILMGLLDARTSIGQHIQERVREEYGDFVFQTVIRRKSRIIEFSFEGLSSRTKQDREALEMYESFVEELKTIVHDK